MSAEKGKHQIVWYWRSFLWPFYVCRCAGRGWEEHGDEIEPSPHLVYDGWHPFFWRRFPAEHSLSMIYAWALQIGPLEIRRWVPDEEMAERLAAHNLALEAEEAR